MLPLLQSPKCWALPSSSLPLPLLPPFPLPHIPFLLLPRALPHQVLDLGVNIRTTVKKGRGGGGAHGARGALAGRLERPVVNCLRCGRIFDCRGVTNDTIQFLGGCAPPWVVCFYEGVGLGLGGWGCGGGLPFL